MIIDKQNKIIEKLNKTDEIKRFKELEKIIKDNEEYKKIISKFNNKLTNEEVIDLRKQLFSIKEIQEYAMLENEIRLFSKKTSNIISSIVDTKKC